MAMVSMPGTVAEKFFTVRRRGHGADQRPWVHASCSYRNTRCRSRASGNGHFVTGQSAAVDPTSPLLRPGAGGRVGGPAPANHRNALRQRRCKTPPVRGLLSAVSAWR
jgi:hypothetical protein